MLSAATMVSDSSPPNSLYPATQALERTTLAAANTATNASSVVPAMTVEQESPTNTDVQMKHTEMRVVRESAISITVSSLGF